MSIEDTGQRRRVIDKVSTDRALELIGALAMENALSKGDEDVIASVEAAILKLRELKLEPTVEVKQLELLDVPMFLRRQAE